jgi:MFS family permease
MEKEKNMDETPHKQAPAKLWTLPFLNIMGVNACITLCNSIITQALPLYVMYLGSSRAVAGTITGVYTISALVCRPFFGNMVDTKGRKITLLVGCGIFTVASFGYSLTSVVAMLLVIRAVQGMGQSAFSTSAGTIVADILPQNRIAEGIGYYGVSFNIATAFGPALMLFVRDNFGYPFVFAGTTIVGLIALGLGNLINYEKKQRAQADTQPAQPSAPAKPREQKRGFSWENAIEKTAIPGALVLILSTFPQGLTQTFLVKYSETLEIAGIGLYFTFNAIAMLLTRLFVGRLCDRIGPQRALPPGLILLFLGIWTIALARSLPAFLVAALLMGFGQGIVNPTIQAFVVRSAPANRRGAASATYYSAFDIGNGAGSMLGGVMAQALGFSATFAVYSIFNAGAIAVFFFVLRKKIIQSNRGC